MNVIRPPVSVSDITKLLLRWLIFKQRKKTLLIHTSNQGLGRNASEECRCRTVTQFFFEDLDRQQRGHEIEKAKSFRFSDDQCRRTELSSHAFSILPLIGTVEWTSEWSPVVSLHAVPGARVRQLHTERPLHVGRVGAQLQRKAQNQPHSGHQHAGKVQSVTEGKSGRKPHRTKRLPLCQTEEIEEVLEQHADTIAEFAAILGVTHQAVRDTARRDTRLLTQFSKDAVIAKMRLLLDHGFTAAEILSRYQVFSRSMSHLQSGLRAMEEVRHYRYRLATLLLAPHLFQQRIKAHRTEVAVMGDHRSQVSFVAGLLEVSEDDLTRLAAQHDFLLTLPPSRLQAIVRLLQDFGLTIHHIRSKCLMLRCPPDVARDRLQRASDAGVLDKHLVPYILTNSDQHFEASFATWTRNAEALGDHANEVQLLMHRLDCSEEEVRELMHRNQRLSTMKSGKLQQCLDVLMNEMGLDADTILQNGGVLYYSPRRLRARWSLLQPLGLTQTQLIRDLMLTERRFVAKYGHHTH